MLNALLLPFLAIFALQLLWYVFRPFKRKAGLSAGDAVFQKRLRLIGVLALVAGLIASAVIYVKAGASPAAADDVAYYVVGGRAFPITSMDSKRDNAELIRMEGKAGVAATELTQWLGRRWRGRNLAVTLASLSAAAFLACFFLARFLTPQDHRADAGGAYSSPPKPSGASGG